MVTHDRNPRTQEAEAEGLSLMPFIFEECALVCCLCVCLCEGIGSPVAGVTEGWSCHVGAEN